MEKYSTYKDSGVEWLGEIPEEWECIRMKHLFKDISVKNRPDAELLSVTQNQGVVPRTWVENRMVMPSGALESFKFIQKGDFAISLRSFEGGLEYCHHDGIISPAYTVLKAQRNFDSQYYKYLFKSNAFISELQTSVVGIREGKNISYPELCYSFLPVPAKAIQTLVAEFLDRKTALIDQAIGIKEKQIDLLKERRQILIHQAVTRGLNPHVKMKDSGVEWIGQVPVGWEVKRLKHVSEFITSGPRGWSDFFSNEGAYFLQSGNLNDTMGIELEDAVRVTPKAGAEGLRTRLKEDDVLVVVTGAKTGKVALAKIDSKEVYINQHLCLIRTNQVIKPSFLSILLHSTIGRTYFYLQQYGLKEGLGLQDVKNALILLPSILEQAEIISYLEIVTQKISSAISLKEKEIEKLKEYKASLINSAVRGKIKVG